MELIWPQPVPAGVVVQSHCLKRGLSPGDIRHRHLWVCHRGADVILLMSRAVGGARLLPCALLFCDWTLRPTVARPISFCPGLPILSGSPDRDSFLFGTIKRMAVWFSFVHTSWFRVPAAFGFPVLPERAGLGLCFGP